MQSLSDWSRELQNDDRSEWQEIPFSQPSTGYFKSTETESLFGTKEKIVEYDFTAGSEAEAEKAMRVLEEKRKAAMERKTEESGQEKAEK